MGSCSTAGVAPDAFSGAKSKMMLSTKRDATVSLVIWEDTPVPELLLGKKMFRKPRYYSRHRCRYSRRRSSKYVPSAREWLSASRLSFARLVAKIGQMELSGQALSLS